MDGGDEYEVESITSARVHGKRGKKITWQYYVKWKGYDWDQSTWEPTSSFQGGSEHILESFWERIDTGGRDISDASAFKKGELLVVSGPPGRKRKASSAKLPVAPAVEDVAGAAISAPPLSSQKRRRVQAPADNPRDHSKRKVPAQSPKTAATSTRSPGRRRASSPGPRKSAPKRQPSAGDSQLDADGETDPDVVEVEDELMQVSTEDADQDAAGAHHSAATNGNANGSENIIFDDLEHFYSGNPIEIDQSMEQNLANPKPVSRTQLRSPPARTVPSSDEADPDAKASASPTLPEHSPLFSPPPSPDKSPEIQKIVPHHRARVIKPLVKLIETTTVETTSKRSRITAKARLMSVQSTAATSTSSSSRNTAKRGGRPGPSQSSSGLILRNRSSLLTVTKGTLQTVKGTFARATEDDQPDEIEEAPAAPGIDEDELHVTSWSNEDLAGQGDQTTLKSRSISPPSGVELLKLAELQANQETLPDYEDGLSLKPLSAEETEGSTLVPAPAEEEPPKQTLSEVTEERKASNHVANPASSTIEAEQTPTVASIAKDISAPSADLAAADEVKKNIELAKEHLFPSAQASCSSFNTTHSSFRSTIFGPLYQGLTSNRLPAVKTEFSTTFKVIFGDGVELPMVLRDCRELKTQISDILIGGSSGGKVALFYSAEDAYTMVGTFKSDGTARAILDPSATTAQQERFSIFLQRFMGSQTLIAPVGKEVCVLYSSEHAYIAEKLGAPTRLRGLSSTLLITHASIENQLGYVAAIMKAAALYM